MCVEPGSPWEDGYNDGYNESFNGKLRDELLNGEVFYTLTEAQILIERGRKHYNQERPHSALGYRPPAPQTKTSETNWTIQARNTQVKSMARSLSSWTRVRGQGRSQV